VSPLEITARLLVMARELGSASKETTSRLGDREILVQAAADIACIALNLETHFQLGERARILAGLSPRRATTGDDHEGSK
jgi:hypothetical protein